MVTKKKPIAGEFSIQFMNGLDGRPKLMIETELEIIIVDYQEFMESIQEITPSIFSNKPNGT
jgi:hypothetical protein